MKTEWDYTHLAAAYLNRPTYSDIAIDAILKIAGIKQNSNVCDVGAGTAHLTLLLAKSVLNIKAVEPNDAMRALGAKRTAALPNVAWYEGTGEKTGQASTSFDLVTFGSSFNVCDRSLALKETARILRPGGWFACLWNHRKLDDPIQEHIEAIIKSLIPTYGYGTRREDQTEIINASGLFGPVLQFSAQVLHEQTVGESVEAWRSHATLARQAGENFLQIVDRIEHYLRSLNSNKIHIPYSTNIWIAQLL